MRLRSRWRPRPAGDDPARGESVQTERDVREAYGRYGDELLGFAVNALGDRQLAEDVVQETFVRAWQSSTRFDPARGSLRTWLFAIARNAVVDAVRRRRSVSGLPAEDEERPPRRVRDPFDRLLVGIQLDEALRKLSADHRQVVLAVHVQGQTCAEIARQHGVPAATIRSRLYYGVRALRMNLEESGGLDS